MRIIIETDNATPMTLQVAPDGGQSTPNSPMATTEEAEAIDAGAAPTDESDGEDDTDESTVEEETFDDSSPEETSAGEAPDDQ